MNKALVFLAVFALFASSNAIWDWGLTGNTNTNSNGHNLGFGNFGFGEAFNMTVDPSTLDLDEEALAAAAAQAAAQALAEAFAAAFNSGGAAAQPSQEVQQKYKLKNEILYEHNFYRESVGSPDLVWDDELAETAKMYAERFVKNNMPEKNYNEAGLLVTYDTGPSFSIFEWGSGKSKMKCFPFMRDCGRYPNVFDKRYSEKDILPYTQVVWKATKEVGCAQSGKYFVCKYYPKGNQYGVAPF